MFKIFFIKINEMICKTSRALNEESELAEDAKELGLDIELCDSKRLAKIDPEIEMDVQGAVWFKQDCHMNPGAFLSQLKEKVIKMGADIHYNLSAKKFIFESGRAKSVECFQINKDVEPSSVQLIDADQFVIAGGSWSSSLANSLGLKLPLIAGKGYSMTLTEPVQLPSICSILNASTI